jgi:hypothetical protein
VQALAQRTCTLHTEEEAGALPERECPICRDDFAAGDKVDSLYQLNPVDP